MTMIKLPRLADRTPVKISINLAPSLADDLAAYAAFYREAYGREEPILELVPAMLTTFLEGDKAFAKFRSTSSDRIRTGS